MAKQKLGTKPDKNKLGRMMGFDNNNNLHVNQLLFKMT